MTRTVSEAMHDAIHLLSASFQPLDRAERESLETFRKACESVAEVLAVRRARPLSTPEMQALARVALACFVAADHRSEPPPPQIDTPPRGFRRKDKP